MDIDGAVDMASTLVVATSTTTPFISLGSTGNSYQTVTGSADGNNVTYRSYQNHIFKNVTGAGSSTDGTERMRLSGGNLLVGKTTTAIGTQGIRPVSYTHLTLPTKRIV